MPTALTAVSTPALIAFVEGGSMAEYRRPAWKVGCATGACGTASRTGTGAAFTARLPSKAWNLNGASSALETGDCEHVAHAP